MTDRIKTWIPSEIDPLEAVIIHRPGPEVENMTPQNAERALYSDILNLSVAAREYEQLKGVLDKVSRAFEVTEMLTAILGKEEVKRDLLTDICCNEGICSSAEQLMELPPEALSRQLVHGVPLVRDTLTKYLSEERFLLRPLHNLFFTRDSAMGVNGCMFTGSMANKVRERETIILNAILKHHPLLETSVHEIPRSGKSGTSDGLATL